jgi:hypothetical protein
MCVAVIWAMPHETGSVARTDSVLPHTVWTAAIEGAVTSAVKCPLELGWS